MKKQVKSFVMGWVILMMLGFLSQSNTIDRTQVQVSVKAPKKLLVRFDNSSERPAGLSISISKSGEVFFMNQISGKKKEGMVYDLSKLSEGQYWLTVDAGDRVYEHEIWIDPSSCKLLKETVRSKPVFENYQRKVFISFENPESEKISVIFRHGMTRFFTDEQAPTEKFAKAYNIANLEPGNYDVDLMAGTDIYTYSFIVR